MASTGQISVRAMKGKFEQLKDEPLATSSSAYRRRRTPFSPIDPSPQIDSTYQPPEEDRTMTTGDDERNLRLRSHSVGNPWASRGSKQHRESNTPRLTPNQSVNVENYDRMQHPFASFTEKQKLVESIVMNIKNSGQLKREEVTRNTNKEPKHKDSLTITSKLEKDIKNALEKGVRKWNNKNAREKFFNEANLETSEKKFLTKFENISKETIPVHQKRSFSKINAILGVDLYPVRSFLSNETVQSHSNNSYIDFRDDADGHYPLSKSGSSPVMFRSLDNCGFKETPENDSGLLREIKHEYENVQLISPYRHNQDSLGGGLVGSTHDLSLLAHDSMISTNGFPDSSSPVRPPRRRSPKKKGRAPLPPQSAVHTRELKATKMQDEFHNSDEDSFNSFNEKRYDDMTNKPLKTSDDLSNKITTCNTVIPLPSGEPPKKPPRTFAYDIYRNLKDSNNGVQSNDFPLRGPPLSPSEIESLYTKPLKRLQDRQTSTLRPPPVRSKSDLCQKLLPKPAIAPKPIDIITRAKKRFSVVEPITSTQNEYAEAKTSIKRNTSFRFSFRRSKKNSSGKQNAPIKENQVGHRIKMVAKNWHHKRDDIDRRVQFSRRSKSDDFLHQGHDTSEEYDPIYAVPNNNTEVRPKQKEQELHYMCSPLFLDGTQSRLKYEEDMKENILPHNKSDDSRGRSGLMDGLKQDFRQSCRFVQKRLRSASSHGDRRS